MDTDVLIKGDNITGVDITTGVYLGKVEIYEKVCHKIFDNVKQMTIFLPLNSEKKLRKLPSKELVLENMVIFKNKKLVDAQEIEGSRYKYFKEKLSKTSFKSSIEVLHDLNVLVHLKDISVAERKLFVQLKEKMLHEIAFVLEISFKELDQKYLKEI